MIMCSGSRTSSTERTIFLSHYVARSVCSPLLFILLTTHIADGMCVWEGGGVSVEEYITWTTTNSHIEDKLSLLNLNLILNFGVGSGGVGGGICGFVMNLYFPLGRMTNYQ